MQKVFVFVEDYVYDFEREIRTTLYSTIEKARKALKDTLKEEKEDSWLSAYINKEGEFDDEIVVDKGKDSIDIYIDGNASEYETRLYIEEKEVL